MVQGQIFKDIADAIREKDGSSELMKITDMPQKIRDIPQGGDERPDAPLNDVMFIDYDGTCLFSYSAEDFLQLSEMPTPPEHDILLFEKWNHTRDEIVTQLQTTGAVIVGALYLTKDEKTHVFIDIPEDNVTLHFFIGCYSTGQVHEIEFGDGEMFVGTMRGSYTAICSHTYSTAGTYEVKFKYDDTYPSYYTTMGRSGVAGPYFISTRSANNTNGGTYVRAWIKKIYFGYQVTNNWCTSSGPAYLQNLECMSTHSRLTHSGIGYMPYLKGLVLAQVTGSSGGIKSLKAISIPPKTYSFSTISGYTQTLIKKIVIPPNCVGYSSGWASNQYAEEIIIGTGVTISEISYSGAKRIIFNDGIIIGTGSGYFDYNYYLEEVIFKGSPDKIGAKMFYSSSLLRVVDLSNCTSVPTLANTNAFSSYASYELIVPDELYDTWITSTNWSSAGVLANIVKKSESSKYGGSA